MTAPRLFSNAWRQLLRPSLGASCFAATVLVSSGCNEATTEREDIEGPFTLSLQAEGDTFVFESARIDGVEVGRLRVRSDEIRVDPGSIEGARFAARSDLDCLVAVHPGPGEGVDDDSEEGETGGSCEGEACWPRVELHRIEVHAPEGTVYSAEVETEAGSWTSVELSGFEALGLRADAPVCLESSDGDPVRAKAQRSRRGAGTKPGPRRLSSAELAALSALPLASAPPALPPAPSLDDELALGQRPRSHDECLSTSDCAEGQSCLIVEEEGVAKRICSDSCYASEFDGAWCTDDDSCCSTGASCDEGHCSTSGGSSSSGSGSSSSGSSGSSGTDTFNDGVIDETTDTCVGACNSCADACTGLADDTTDAATCGDCRVPGGRSGLGILGWLGVIAWVRGPIRRRRWRAEQKRKRDALSSREDS